MGGEYVSVYSTFPDRECAARIAKTLVDEGLVACANIFAVNSVYRWQGEVETSSEHAALMKTRRVLFDKIEHRILELHPYDLPAIVAYSLENGAEAYLEWIAASTRQA